jgi:hypothetical protein
MTVTQRLMGSTIDLELQFSNQYVLREIVEAVSTLQSVILCSNTKVSTLVTLCTSSKLKHKEHIGADQPQYFQYDHRSVHQGNEGQV